MSLDVDLVAGMAALIDGAGLGVYDPDRAWTAGDTSWAVMLRSVPQDPPKVIALSLYSVDDDPKLTDSTRGVQIRLRGDENPESTLDLNAALFDLFQGRHDTTINGVAVVLMWRQSFLPGPQDTESRWQLTSNWYVRTADPTQFRED